MDHAPVIISGLALIINGLFVPIAAYIFNGIRGDIRTVHTEFMRHITDRAAHCKKG